MVTPPARIPDERLEVLEVRGLTAVYPGTENGVHDIDLRVPRGSFTVVVEMARGEVTDARVEGSLSGASRWAAKVEACALDAAYSIRVPRVIRGSGPDTVHVARYPLTFRIVDSRGRVVEGREKKVHGTEDPLDGL